MKPTHRVPRTELAVNAALAVLSAVLVAAAADEEARALRVYFLGDCRRALQATIWQVVMGDPRAGYMQR